MSVFDPAREDHSDIDREIHIERMKRELEDLAGGSMISGAVEPVSPELEEIYLEHVCEIEKGPWDTYFNRLVDRGIEMRCFLENTDHLSDRELYTWLWSDGLREETPDVSQLGGAWHTSPIGSGTDEDINIFLKYYASEKERRRWKADFPNDPLPPHCALPYHRDRRLPRSE
jgi:hypothetical protein